MKNILIVILICFCGLATNGQTYPTPPQKIGNANILLNAAGGLTVGQSLMLPSFNDTTAANTLGFPKNYAGSLIFTTSDNNTWVRNNSMTKWIKTSGSGGGTPAGNNTAVQFNDNGVFGGDETQFAFNQIPFGETHISMTPTGNVYIRPEGNIHLGITGSSPDSSNVIFDNINSSTPTETGTALGVDAIGRVITVATSGNAWGLTGNAGINSSNFLGTVSNNDLRFRTNNIERLNIDSAGDVSIALNLNVTNAKVLNTLYAKQIDLTDINDRSNQTTIIPKDTGQFNVLYIPKLRGTKYMPISVNNNYSDSNGNISVTIPSQVNSDWNATSGVAEILNKPTIPSAQNWQQTLNVSSVLNKWNSINSNGNNLTIQNSTLLTFGDTAGLSNGVGVSFNNPSNYISMGGGSFTNSDVEGIFLNLSTRDYYMGGGGSGNGNGVLVRDNFNKCYIGRSADQTGLSTDATLNQVKAEVQGGGNLFIKSDTTIIQSQGNNQLLIDNINNNLQLMANGGNVGIGITTPSDLLHIYSPDSNALRIQAPLATGSSTDSALTIDVSGRVHKRGLGGGSVSLPLSEIGFGSGSGITSSINFSWDNEVGLFSETLGNIYFASDAGNFNIVAATGGTLATGGELYLNADSVKIDIPSKGNGKVLTSSATGLATWQTPTNGTVTSITPAYGFTYTTPITTSGSLTIDSGRANKQLTTGYDLNKVKDSLQTNINAKGFGTLTSLTPVYGFISTTPITTTGSLTIDSGRGNAQLTTGYDLNKVRDSLQANINGKLSTAVTSVATGLGLTGGTITTTGTLSVDTANASILSRQRAAATYAPISINGTVTSVATGLGLSGGTITTTGTLLVDTSSASIISRQRAAATYVPLTGQTADSTYSGTITWNGTPPTTPTVSVWRVSKSNSVCTVQIALNYTNAGTTNTQLTLDLPSTAPTPYAWGLGTTTNTDYSSQGSWVTGASVSPATPSIAQAVLRKSSGGYEIRCNSVSSISAKFAIITISYFY